jgi:hypothetical protein
LPHGVVDRLKAPRGPAKSYSAKRNRAEFPAFHGSDLILLSKGRSIAIIARSWLFWLALLLTGAAVFILGVVFTIALLSYGDCSAAAGYYGCAYPLAGIFVLALGCVLLILAAVAISYLCYRDWNSVD